MRFARLLSLLPLLPVALPAQAQNAAPVAAPVAVQGRTQRVVMVVWDGLRPDSVSQRDTPTLFRMAQQGVTFARHHPVYPSSTEVNGTALSTGVYPAHSGIIGNNEYRPAINALKPVSTESLEAVRQGDTGGSYLAVATVAEIVQRAGFPTAIAGTKPVVLLADRSETRTSPAALASTDIFGGDALPATALAPIVQAQGAFPKVEYPNTPQDTWTTNALTQTLWQKEVPKFSLLWLSDVDYTQHDSAPGSPAALAALKSCDDRLATVLSALQAKGVRDTTTVFVVSDHGFSTVNRNIDLYEALQNAGFQAPREFTSAPKSGEIVIVGLGGSAFFYVGGHDRAVTRRLAEFLQSTDWAGVLFSRDGIEGTFALNQVHIDSPGAPDLAMSFRWGAEANAFGVAGSMFADPKRKVGRGSHATLSRFDMHNTLIANGPDFKPGFVDETPSGNTDLAPTILHLLGMAAPHDMDGRVLKEALLGAGRAENPSIATGRLEASATINGVSRRQYLQWSRVDGTLYFDEGNADSKPMP